MLLTSNLLLSVFAYELFLLSFCELQFGFRKKHSANHALVSLTEDIQYALDNNYFASGVFIDLQKVFDTVDHNILLSKLYHYGIRGKANDWLKSYFTNRKQFVSINGFNSKELSTGFLRVLFLAHFFFWYT